MLLWLLFCYSLLISYNSKVAFRGEDLVTVILPCYNCRESWLRETMNSLRTQTFPKFKVLIVDDGSHPALQLNSEITHDLDVSLIRHKRNRGLPAARNTGVEHSRSKFVIFLDPDDLVEPTCLEKLLLAYWLWNREEGDVGFVYPGTMQFRTGPQGERLPYYYHAIPYSKRELLSLDRGFIPSFALIPRQLYLEAGGMCSLVRGYEDYDFWLRLWAFGYHGKVLPERLFWYRRHDRGRTREIEARELEWRDELRLNNPRLFRQIVKDLDEDVLERDGPCYPKQKPTFSKVTFSMMEYKVKFPMIESLFADHKFVYLMIPWMERGGAEKYELDLLTHCFPNVRIVIITDTRSDHPWRQKYEAIPNSELFHLEHFHRNSNLAVEYLFKSRPPRAILIRNSWLGYETSRRWGKIFPFMDIQHLKNQRWQQLSDEHEEFLLKRIALTPELQRSNKTVVVGPMVNEKLWTYGHRKQYTGTYRVAFIGRMEEQKDPHRWTKITSHLPKPAWSHLIIGQGSLRKVLPVDDAYEWIDEASVLKRVLVEAPTVVLLTSRYEGVPITVLECLAAGIPVVAPSDLFSHISDPLLLRFDRKSRDSDIAKIVQSAIKLYFEYPQGIRRGNHSFCGSYDWFPSNEVQ